MNFGPLMLIALIGAHCFFDYAGQGDFMAMAKHPKSLMRDVPPWIVLCSHAAIHASAAALITGLWPVFIGEFVGHTWTDSAKCNGKIGFAADQAIHLVHKIAWFLLAWWVA